MVQDNGVILWAVNAWPVILPECYLQVEIDPNRSLQRQDSALTGCAEAVMTVSHMFYRHMYIYLYMHIYVNIIL